MKTKRLNEGETVTWVDRRGKKPIKRTLTISKKACDLREMTNLQTLHNKGELDVYQPIEAYSQQWKTVFDKQGNYVSAHPVGEPKRNDLPPVYMQWKQDYSRRYVQRKN